MPNRVKRWLVAPALCLIAVALPTATAAAEQPERSVAIKGENSVSWAGQMATGANVDYNAQSGEPCGDGVSDQCETTLLSTPGTGVLRVTIDDYAPNPASDFDLYVYESDVQGERGPIIDRSTNAAGEPESITFRSSRSHYVIQVVYFAVTGSAYTGTVQRDAPPLLSCDTPTESYDTGGAPNESAAVNDPLFSRQWALAQIRAPQAWARGVLGKGATIAIVDSGVDLNHPDLQTNLVRGIDLGDAAGCPAGPQDEDGHGTQVAGIAAAATDNGIGIAGVAPAAKIMPVKIKGADGTNQRDDVVAGIRYAADHRADVINLSLGTPVPAVVDSVVFPGLQEAVDYAWQKGSVVVAAAGNDGDGICTSPAFLEHAVCVAATDRRGLPTYWSAFPVNPSFTALRAPGGFDGGQCEFDEDIWSTIWPGSANECSGESKDRITGAPFTDGYDTGAGTSLAAPHVAGVAALLAGQGLTNQQIVDRLKATSSNKGSYDPVFGYGIVDADAATRD